MSPSRSGSGAAAPDGSITGTFSVGARRLNLECTGTGSPTVVLEAGDGVPSSEMGEVVESEFSDRVRVCSYDRANTGGSDSGAPLPRRHPDVVTDLHGLLAAAKVPAPYVLVGSSAGGMLVQAYAKTHPADVAGVVALNPVPPWDEWAERAFPEMTASERDDETAYFGGTGSSEAFDFRQISQQIASTPAPDGVPFHMVVSSSKQCESPDDICGRTYPAYVEITKSLSEGWPQGSFTQAGAGHELYLSDPGVVVDAINDVLER
ncbi:alpha/beta fold hydrolase [uncultured Phycicoccus sp.]|uniref:alpha/beta fold hydrolase n=1 Tax=uncultured Phycicoccus sp. TaxID=661422 RepID=UPI002636FD09|nr:alpha/beta hydrolase [uncultured Phycicoccus sp.]